MLCPTQVASNPTFIKVNYRTVKYPGISRSPAFFYFQVTDFTSLLFFYGFLQNVYMFSRNIEMTLICCFSTHVHCGRVGSSATMSYPPCGKMVNSTLESRYTCFSLREKCFQKRSKPTLSNTSSNLCNVINPQGNMKRLSHIYFILECRGATYGSCEAGNVTP